MADRGESHEERNVKALLKGSHVLVKLKRLNGLKLRTSYQATACSIDIVSTAFLKFNPLDMNKA